jgi:transposase
VPYRMFAREQDWLLPPSLSELLAADHPVRFVAEWVDTLALAEVGISRQPAEEGAPAYHPQVLLAAWLYGFMVQVRSSRQLERACRENIAFMWLTGLQGPDHVTLWRFYNSNRQAMRHLLKQTVRLATEVGLVDFALQAVDGCRVSAASRDSLREREAVEKLLAQVEAEIAAMEQANQEEPGPDSRGSERADRWSGKQAWRQRLQQALDVLAQRNGTPPGAGPGRPAAAERTGQHSGESRVAAPNCEHREAVKTVASEMPAGGQPGRRARAAKQAVSLSAPDAIPFMGRRGFGVGYNGQAMVDGKAQIVVAAEVVAAANDNRLLPAMLVEVQAMTDRLPAAVVADTGYFAIPDIVAAEAQGVAVFVPDRRQSRADAPDHNLYHKQHFTHNPEDDTYTCPEGRRLYFRYVSQWRDQPVRVYTSHNCHGCPAQLNGACTKATARSLAVFGHEADLKAHATKMQSAAGKAALRRRKAIIEPVFAEFRERLGLQRFLVRGLAKAQAEWRLLCVAHNLRKLYVLWWRARVLSGIANA